MSAPRIQFAGLGPGLAVRETAIGLTAAPAVPGTVVLTKDGSPLPLWSARIGGTEDTSGAFVTDAYGRPGGWFDPAYYGEEVTVTYDGAGPITFILGLEGPKGDIGNPGFNITWQGEWDSTKTYAFRDGVNVGSTRYISQQAGNHNHDPSTDDGTWWITIMGAEQLDTTTRSDRRVVSYDAATGMLVFNESVTVDPADSYWGTAGDADDLGNGTDDTVGVLAAWNAAQATGARFHWSKKHLMSAPIPLTANGMRVDGIGKGLCGIVNKTTDCVRVGGSVSVNHVRWQNCTVHSVLGGGHGFVNVGGCGQCIFDYEVLQDNDAKSAWSSTAGGTAVMICNDFSKSNWRHTLTATVPSVNCVDNGGGINGNTWDRCRGTFSGNYAIHIETTSSSSYAYKNEVTRFTAEVCVGGCVRILSGYQTVLDRVFNEDCGATPQANDAIIVGQGNTPFTKVNGAGQVLSPTPSTLTVLSTTGFPSSGTLPLVAGVTSPAVTYTGKTGTTFTGCTIPTGSLTAINGGIVAGVGTGTLSRKTEIRAYTRANTTLAATAVDVRLIPGACQAYKINDDDSATLSGFTVDLGKNAGRELNGNTAAWTLLNEPVADTNRVFTVGKIKTNALQAPILRRGQTGIMAPDIPCGFGSQTLVAGDLYFGRFSLAWLLTTGTVIVNLITPAGSNDPLEVAVFDATGTVQLVTAGIGGPFPSTLLNGGAGDKTMTLPAFNVDPDVNSTCYVAVLCKTIGTTAAALGAKTVVNSNNAALFGSGLGAVEMGVIHGQTSGMPTSLASPSLVPTVPHVTFR